MRCFLAVPLEQPALGTAQALLDALRHQYPDVRWVRPDALHLTVHFFGGIGEDDATRALEAVRPAVESTSAFEMSLDALGAFPDRGSPRVLWLGTTREPPRLLRLATSSREALSRAGFEVESRPFRAHCTLGRPRTVWPPLVRQAWRMLAAQPVDAAPFVAARLVLYESVHATGGKRYLERSSLALSSRAP